MAIIFNLLAAAVLILLVVIGIRNIGARPQERDETGIRHREEP
jgi:hypothetical protein